MPPRIESAQRHLSERLLRLPGVTAVGIGDHEGAPCLRVWVIDRSEELMAAIPSDWAGFVVVVEESGRIEARDEAE